MYYSTAWWGIVHVQGTEHVTLHGKVPLFCEAVFLQVTSY